MILCMHNNIATVKLQINKTGKAQAVKHRLIAAAHAEKIIAIENIKYYVCAMSRVPK